MCNCGDLMLFSVFFHFLIFLRYWKNFQSFPVYLFIFFLSILLQLQERIQDLEKERDLLKENCDKLVRRWEDWIMYIQ